MDTSATMKQTFIIERGHTMSLKIQPIQPVPEITASVARAAFPKGNGYLQLRNELGVIYEDDLFSELYPCDGQPAVSPWRLVLVTRLVPY